MFYACAGLQLSILIPVLEYNVCCQFYISKIPLYNGWDVQSFIASGLKCEGIVSDRSGEEKWSSVWHVIAGYLILKIFEIIYWRFFLVAFSKEYPMFGIFDMFQAFTPTTQEIQQEMPNIFSWHSSWLQALNAPDAEENLRELTAVVTAPVQLKNDKAHSSYWESTLVPARKIPPVSAISKERPKRAELRLVVVGLKSEAQDFSHWPYKNRTGT